MERFYKGARNLLDGQTSNLQTFIAAFYHKPLYLSNLYMHGLGIITYKLWFVKPISCKTFIQNLLKFAQKIKKTFIKIYKGLINQEKRFETGKKLVLRNLCFFISVYGIHLIEVRQFFYWQSPEKKAGVIEGMQTTILKQTSIDSINQSTHSQTQFSLIRMI